MVAGREGLPEEGVCVSSDKEGPEVRCSREMGRTVGREFQAEAAPGSERGLGGWSRQGGQAGGSEVVGEFFSPPTRSGAPLPLFHPSPA